MLYRDNGKENGSYYSILGLYRDNGRENGNYCIIRASKLHLKQAPINICTLYISLDSQRPVGFCEKLPSHPDVPQEGPWCLPTRPLARRLQERSVLEAMTSGKCGEIKIESRNKFCVLDPKGGGIHL